MKHEASWWRRPEPWVFATAVVSLALAAGVATVLLGGPVTPVRCLLAIIPVLLVLVAALYPRRLVAPGVQDSEDSTLDELTGLLSRRALAPRFAELAEQASLNGQPVSVVAVDVDHFKRVNEEHGHAAGDEVLREIARVFRERLRTFELLYRTGGDEFLLVLPGADAATAGDIADALRRAVDTLRPAGLDMSCSCGVATGEGAKVSVQALLEEADAALHHAKRRGAIAAGPAR